MPTNLDGNLGPAPWTPGSGLIAEDVIDYMLPILDQRARGIPLKTIAADLGLPMPRVASLVLMLSRAVAHDLKAYGHETDPRVLDDQASA